MPSIGTTILDIRLDDPACEEQLHTWLGRLFDWLGRTIERVEPRTYVEARGKATVVLEFRYPGTWKRVRAHPEFLRLLGDLPTSELGERITRRWDADGQGRDLTSATLVRWLAERDRGARDFVVVDVLAPDGFARRHLPGAVNLPRDATTPERVETLLGPDRARAVVVYCSGFD